MNIYDYVVRYLNEEKKGMVATVVNKAGAAPREEGAKMFIGEDRKPYGTIGGGRLEAEVIDEALKSMDATVARLIHVRMDAKAVADEGMLCGGNVDVLLEPVFNRHKEVYEGIGECGKRGIKAVLITRFKKIPLEKSLIDSNGIVWGDSIGKDELAEVRDFWDENRVRLVDNDTLVEPILAFPDLYIFGAGHVSQFLAKVAKMVDFNVTVIDDRAEFANKERFPEADNVIVEDFNKVFNHLDFSRKPYLVIVTRGHSHDALVLEKSIEQPTRYIGMIGSNRKVRMVLDYLREKGLKKDILESVHAPIGLDIKSETPQEIAISIVAELIQVRGMDH
ncbi:MAG: XshC-Cox1-family protein [Deltaproteobacteria bacterium]|nr:XshC-Cox1-family protein [Deltaproteobacteria bacterium]